MVVAAMVAHAVIVAQVADPVVAAARTMLGVEAAVARAALSMATAPQVATRLVATPGASVTILHLRLWLRPPLSRLCLGMLRVRACGRQMMRYMTAIAPTGATASAVTGTDGVWRDAAAFRRM
mmetsp:Transcript_22783/g.36079  ORF Transcript_22783/g.36079 Transcript_22783/m.36079 type:complete len:123 (-) Transcript_22783:918-1286(-)